MHVDKEQIFKEILSLDSSKASQPRDMPTKIIKDNADMFSDFLLSGFNNSITTSIFPSSLKQAIITPVFKRGDKNLKENYRPVSILPNLSKIFEDTTRSITLYSYLKNGNQRLIKENILVRF